MFAMNKALPLAGTGRRASVIAFMLMGTAFLLRETKSIVWFHLLLGTTRFNNALVFRTEAELSDRMLG